MPPLHREHFVDGPFTLKGGKLTFQCGAVLAYDARRAIDADQVFTVTLTAPDGAKEATGKVLSVELVKGAAPPRYEIVMRVPR